MFRGQSIPSYHKLEETALKLHQQNDKCKLIGWDLALDSESTPILIEGNTIFPGISFEQMCSGPIFRERTDEVIDYLKYNKYIHTVVLYH